VLAGHLAGSSFRHPEPLTQLLDGCALEAQGQKFHSAGSLSIDLLSSASAHSFFRTFSASSSLRRLASEAFMPPYRAKQRCQVDDVVSRFRQTSSSSWPVASNRLRSINLRMI